MGLGMFRYGWSAFGMGGVPAGWVLVPLALSAVRARALMDRHWEELVERYPEHLEALEVGIGRILRTSYPRVHSHHGQSTVRFEDPEAQSALSLVLAEPLRTSLGWGGATLQAERAGSSVPLPVHELFLAFARGSQAEWVARVGGLPWHHAALVGPEVLGDVARAAFGPPSAPASGI